MADLIAQAREKIADREREKTEERPSIVSGVIWWGPKRWQCGWFLEGAELFKEERAWQEAGDAYVKAAEYSRTKGESSERQDGQLSGKYNCNAYYSQAADCYKNIDPQLAIDCYLKISEMNIKMGKPTCTARNNVDIAKKNSELHDKEMSIKHYQKAADFRSGGRSRYTRYDLIVS